MGHRHPWRVLLAALLFTALMAAAGTRLSIDPDLKALLPADYPSVTRLEQLRQRIGTQSDFVVEVNSPDRAANIKFGEALAKRMEPLPELRYVIFHRDLSFFEDNGLLYLPLADLLDLRRRVIRRVRDEVRGETVVDLLGDDEEDEADETSGGDGDDPFDMDQGKLVEKYFGGAEAPGEYMEAQGGRILVIKARPTEQTTNVEFAAALVAKVRGIIAELGPASFHPELKAMVRAEYSDRTDETKEIRGDVLTTVLFSVSLLLLVIGCYFRSLRALPIVILPVLAATVATLGLGSLVLGTFNLVTTFIFAILLGLGIDFGIHCLARYQFERQRDMGVGDALRVSLASTGTALAFGAMTTMAVFFLLQLGRFRGFSQFGALAGMGVFLALVATLFMVPALVTVAERIRPYKPKKRPAVEASAPRDHAGTGRRGVMLAWLVVAVSVAVGAVSVAHILDIPFEYDFGKLGKKSAPPPPRPAGAPEPKPEETYEHALGMVTTYAPAVATCDTEAQCAKVSELLGLLRRLDDGEMARLRRLAAGKPLLPEKKAAVDDEDPDACDEDDEDCAVAPDPFAAQEAALAGGKLLPEELKSLIPLGVERLEEMRYFLQAYLGLHMFVPRHQPLKLKIIADIRRRIDDKRALLKPETEKKVADWYSYLRVKEPVTAAALPVWVKRQMEEVDGTLGRFVIMWNRGAKADYADAVRLYKAFFELPVAGATGEVTVPVAANYFVLVEVIDTLKEDGPVVLSAATAAVFICLLFSFRSLRSALLVLVPLLVSVSWLAGVHLLLGWKLNMFSVVAFPLLVGIGIDNGIHVFHRWREVRQVRVVLREVGGPIALTAVTTFIGFSGLLLANHVGINTLGITAAAGIALALVGSVGTLPALLYCLDRPKESER